MTIQNAIKKIQSLSGMKVQKNEVNLYWVNYKGYTISFHVNGRLDENGNGEATNYYVKREDLTDDYQADYFAGSFWDNLTRCFKYVNRTTQQN